MTRHDNNSVQVAAASLSSRRLSGVGLATGAKCGSHTHALLAPGSPFALAKKLPKRAHRLAVGWSHVKVRDPCWGRRWGSTAKRGRRREGAARARQPRRVVASSRHRRGTAERAAHHARPPERAARAAECTWQQSMTGGARDDSHVRAAAGLPSRRAAACSKLTPRAEDAFRRHRRRVTTIADLRAMRPEDRSLST